MLRPSVSIALTALLTLACSSSSSPAKEECFNGTYDVTFGANTTGDALCAELTGQKGTSTYVVNTASGTITHAVPSGETAGPTLYDEQACTASELYTRPSQDAAQCPTVLDTFNYDLTFTPTGFAGTFKSATCTKDLSGALVTQKCSYPMQGTKR